MNNNQSARLDMNYTTKKELEDNIETVKTVPVFYDMYKELDNNITGIEKAAALHSQNDTGVTDGKRNIRHELEEQTYIITSVVRAYARNNGLFDLAGRLKNPPSKLMTMGGNRLLSFARQVLEAANEQMSYLGTYPIDNAMVQQYNDIVNLFATNIAGPQQALANRKSMGITLKELFKENIRIHEEMKPLAVVFKKTHPEFYGVYINCTQIRNANTHHTQARGTTTAKINGKLLTGVSVKAEGTNYTTTSDRSGNYKLLIPEEGVYTLVFEMEDYETVRVENVVIAPGEKVTVDVQMVLKVNGE